MGVVREAADPLEQTELLDRGLAPGSAEEEGPYGGAPTCCPPRVRASRPASP